LERCPLPIAAAILAAETSYGTGAAHLSGWSPQFPRDATGEYDRSAVFVADWREPGFVACHSEPVAALHELGRPTLGRSCFSQYAHSHDQISQCRP
jgi:hypothetical protein